MLRRGSLNVQIIVLSLDSLTPTNCPQFVLQAVCYKIVSKANPK